MVDKILQESKKPNGEDDAKDSSSDEVKEIGGPKGLEPTRYGDWENNGRCWDF